MSTFRSGRKELLDPGLASCAYAGAAAARADSLSNDVKMGKPARLGVLLIVALMICGANRCWGQEASAAQCTALERVDFSGIQDAPVQIIGVNVVEAKGKEPAYCRVSGYVAPQVGFELRLPISNWNGKFFEVGCGGSCGHLGWTGWCPTERGYACMVADMGHKGKDQDGLWAVNNLQAQIDFGYRGPHVAALAGKAITEHYYGKAPKCSYFRGCSTGGPAGAGRGGALPLGF